MKTKVDTAEQGFHEVGQAVATVTGAVNQVAAQVGNIPTDIPINLDAVSFWLSRSTLTCSAAR